MSFYETVYREIAHDLGTESTPFERIEYVVAERIATITIARESKLNALDAATIVELMRAVLLARADESVRAIVLTGAGEKAFVAGADIAEMAPLSSDEARAFAERGQQLTLLVERLEKPIIAAINGFALGGGCELALACHIRIASDKAKFGQPEVKLGLVPGFGGSQRLPRLVGKGRALELLLGGGMIDADEALRIGLVNRVVAPEELAETARDLAKQIAANAPLAVGYCMAAVASGLEMPIEEALRMEAALFGLCFSTEDMREGTAAFLEKRKAEFKGR